jgi:predicted permease
VFFPPPGAIAVNLSGEIDWRVLVFSAGVCLVSTMLFGLVPALQTSKIDLAAALKSESGPVFGGQGRSKIRSSLVLIQVALSFVLLVGAGLIIRSMQRIKTSDPGFSTDNVLMTSVDLVAAGYDAQRAKEFQDALVDRLQAMGGVQSAAWARINPFSYASYFLAPITVEGYQVAPNEQPSAQYLQVSPAYFATMGIPIVSGREFTRADNETAPLVAVVNEKMVGQYWHGQDPVGKRIQVKDQWLQVVGVAKTSKYQTFQEAPKAFFYVPLRQNMAIRAFLNIRTSRDPAAMATAVPREIRALDANLAPSEIVTMREHINQTALATQQIAVALLSIFGGLALLLAGIGLYGVMSYSVSQRTRELGLRMALGAGAAHVLRRVISHGFALTAGGILVGLAASLGLTRLIGNLLYQVDPRDPLAFGLALAVMLITSMTACFLPAWRATRIDPVQALRE